MMKITRSDCCITVKFITVCIILLIFVAGCEFPRGNPLDPKAYNYGLMEPEDPELPVLQVTSFHSSQWYPFQDLYYLEALVYGADAEDADSVNFVYRDTVFFSMNHSGDVWHQSLESASFLSENIFDLIGVQHYAVLYYGIDEPITTEESCLYRIIEEVPETIYPIENVTVSLDFELNWEPANVKYSFSYTLSINFVATSGYVSEIKRIENISSDLTSYLYSENLMNGSYFWTISIVDNFSNISRSKEAAFVVAQ